MIAIFFVTAFMWSQQELPLIDLTSLPESHWVRLEGHRVNVRNWLMKMEHQINGGKGNGQLSLGEFKLLKGLRTFPALQRWETFASFRSFLTKGRKAILCLDEKKRICPPLPRIPKIPVTFLAKTQTKRRKIRYHYSRYARKCREMSLGSSSFQPKSNIQEIAKHSHYILQRTKQFVLLMKNAPKLHSQKAWRKHFARKLKEPAFRKKLKSFLGFLPSRQELRLLASLSSRKGLFGRVKIGKIAMMALRSPRFQKALPMLLSGWLFMGDKRSRKEKWKEWKQILRGSKTNCLLQGNQQVANSRFFCGTTLWGAFRMLSIPPLFNHTVRFFTKPIGRGVRTFQESTRSCLAQHIGAWMKNGSGSRCLTKAQKTKLFSLLVRTTMLRYEPYAQARVHALRSLATWRIHLGLSCFLMALHPRREPQKWVRSASIDILRRLAVEVPSLRYLIITYLRHSTQASFEPHARNRGHALVALAQLNDRMAVPAFLKNFYFGPGVCYGQFAKLPQKKHWMRARIPKEFWNSLFYHMDLYQRPVTERFKLLRLVQCGKAPTIFAQKMMQSLHPSKEKRPHLRKALWRSLQIRYLHLIGGSGWRFGSSGNSFIYRRNLLNYLRYVGLNSKVERNPGNQKMALEVAASLRLPQLVSLLVKQSKQAPQNWTIRGLRSLFGQMVLWPTHHLRYLTTKSWDIRILRLGRVSYPGFSVTQKRKLFSILLQFSRSTRDVGMRKEARRILRLLSLHSPDPLLKSMALAVYH